MMTWDPETEERHARPAGQTALAPAAEREIRRLIRGTLYGGGISRSGPGEGGEEQGQNRPR